MYLPSPHSHKGKRKSGKVERREDEIILQRSISLLILRCSCVCVCVCTPPRVCVCVCGGGGEYYFRSEQRKKGFKNKLALCGNSFSQITQHSSTDANAHKHPLTPSQLQHEGTVPHSHTNRS